MYINIFQAGNPCCRMHQICLAPVILAIVQLALTLHATCCFLQTAFCNVSNFVVVERLNLSEHSRLHDQVFFGVIRAIIPSQTVLINGGS